jgi:hypothetical protein
MFRDMPKPPVTIVKVPLAAGSYGYGAKVDGDIICIPHNKSVRVSTMPRKYFDELPMYAGE